MSWSTPEEAPSPEILAVPGDLAVPRQNNGGWERLRWVFIGSDGIRAGWRIVIFIALIAAFSLIARLLSHGRMPVPKGEIPAGFFLIRETILIAAVVAAGAVMGWIEGRSAWSYGLAGPRKLTLVSMGGVGGLATLSALVAILVAGGYLSVAGVALATGPAVYYALLWGLVFLLVGMGEELLFRGYLQFTLARAMGFWPAALVMSLLFGAGHYGNGGETIFGLAGVVIAGLAFCLLLWLSGSLWLGIGFHAAWDWAQSYLYGTPDSGLMMHGHLLITHAAGNARLSGGSVGPEGSLLAAPVMLAGLLLLALTLRETRLTVNARI
ncbi:MAG TPA: type II CAAX endopeptidase family protein [Acetobacteraceae bacterium]|nr:type II CAAX endopeptidase family protein [Acetobacteraceae bacterium]